MSTPRRSRIRQRLLFGLFLFSTSLAAQVHGLWLVESVTMGDRSMTPVARWTRINPDHTYQSGNGWLQNSAGTWAYDPPSAAFLPRDGNGPADPFGAFTISFAADTMIWVREEGGVRVQVRWTPIRSLPRSHVDRVVGRWDRIAVENPDSERRLAYWMMNAHRPELELIPLDHYGENSRWVVRFEGDDRMVWTARWADKEGEVKVYERVSAND